MKNLIKSFIFLFAIALTSAARADIKMQVGDSFTFTVVEPISIEIGRQATHLHDGMNCFGFNIYMKKSERYSRTIKPGTSYNVKITDLLAYRGSSTIKSWVTFGTNSSETSEVLGISSSALSAPLLSELISNFKMCPTLKFESFTPSGHEESTEVE